MKNLKNELLEKFHSLGRKYEVFMQNKKEMKNVILNLFQNLNQKDAVENQTFCTKLKFRQKQSNKFGMTMGFTLAETLITLMVIGVVAVLVIPAFINNIGDTALQRQRDISQKKLMEGLRQMRTDDVLNKAYTTAEFVEKMRSYFKIDATCDSNNLTKCFYETINVVIDNETKEKNVADLKTAKSINSDVDYDSAVYSLKLSDGSSMLIYTDPTCIGPASGAQESDPAKCISYLIDVDGSKGANSTPAGTAGGNKDIIGNMVFTGAKLILLGFNGSWGSMTEAECEELVKTDSEFANRIQYSSRGCNDDNDYWAQAVYECQKKGMRLPTEAELTQLATDLGCPACGSDGCCDKNNTKMASSILAGWNGKTYLWLWASSLDSYSAAYLWFFGGSSGYESGPCTDNLVSAVCVK